MKELLYKEEVSNCTRLLKRYIVRSIYYRREHGPKSKLSALILTSEEQKRLETLQASRVARSAGRTGAILCNARSLQSFKSLLFLRVRIKAESLISGHLPT